MKFSSLSASILLMPFTLIVALPQSVIDTDDTCSSKYCAKYTDSAYACAKANNFELHNIETSDPSLSPGYNDYVKCICDGGELESLFKQCLTCYTNKAQADQALKGYEAQCSGGSTKDSTDSSTKDKKSDAAAFILGKVDSGLKMAGVVVVVGGLIAAM